MGVDSYTNVNDGNIIGCTCTDQHLNPFLATASGYLILTSLSGSFNVTEVVVQACDDPTQNSCGNSVTVYGTISRIVAIDIMPGTQPNKINLDSGRVVPVAILGSATFDATQVDPATVRLAGASVSVTGKGDKYSCNEKDVNADGFLDLVCRVKTTDFVIEAGDSLADLTAQTFAGERIWGEDSIEIMP